jgi:hypothetical protein
MYCKCGSRRAEGRFEVYRRIRRVVTASEELGKVLGSQLPKRTIYDI